MGFQRVIHYLVIKWLNNKSKARDGLLCIRIIAYYSRKKLSSLECQLEIVFKNAIYFHPLSHLSLNTWEQYLKMYYCTPPDYLSFISHRWIYRQKHFLFNHKRAVQYFLNMFISQHPLKRTYHFQHHEKEFLGKDRLGGGSRRMQLSASAERKKKTERVVRVKGCLLITAFNSFFHNLWGKVIRFPNT